MGQRKTFNPLLGVVTHHHPTTPQPSQPPSTQISRTRRAFRPRTSSYIPTTCPPSTSPPAAPWEDHHRDHPLQLALGLASIWAIGGEPLPLPPQCWLTWPRFTLDTFSPTFPPPAASFACPASTGAYPNPTGTPLLPEPAGIWAPADPPLPCFQRSATISPRKHCPADPCRSLGFG